MNETITKKKKYKTIIVLLYLFIILLVGVILFNIIYNSIQIADLVAGKMTYFDSYGEHTLTLQNFDFTGLIINMVISMIICITSIILSIVQIKNLRNNQKETIQISE